MNYSALQSRVLARLNLSSADPAAANVDEYVNEGIHYLESAAPDGWPWMRTTITLPTVTNTASYAFTTIGLIPAVTVTIAKVLSAKVLRSTVYQDLRLLSPQESVEMYPSTNTGPPEAFFVEGSTLYLYPTPNAVYSVPLRVVIGETDLGGNSSTPVLPVVFHSAIVEAAALLMYETIQDSAKLAQQEQRVQGYLKRMREYGRQYPAAPSIRVREWPSG